MGGDEPDAEAVAETGAVCEAGTVPCGAACVDLATDRNHCGNCSTECAGGTTWQCSSGRCCPVPLGRGACDIEPPCGCSPAENCARINGAPEACVPNGGISQAGNCLSTQDCSHGLVCSAGICESPCIAVSDCPANYACFEQGVTQNSQSVDLGYAACEPHCNPVSPLSSDASHAACGPGQQCFLYLQQTTWVTYCLNSTGNRGQGAPCTYATDCAPGFGCTDYTGQPSVCQQYCRVGSFSDCHTGSCSPYATPAYDTNGAFMQEIGVCH